MKYPLRSFQIYKRLKRRLRFVKLWATKTESQFSLIIPDMKRVQKKGFSTGSALPGKHKSPEIQSFRWFVGPWARVLSKELGFPEK